MVISYNNHNDTLVSVAINIFYGILQKYRDMLLEDVLKFLDRIKYKFILSRKYVVCERINRDQYCRIGC